MVGKAVKFGWVISAILALSACGGGGTLEDMNAASDGPDEFSVLPGKPLQSPQDFANLPVPTPGGQNLTDPTPNIDAVTALGGRSAVSRSGVPVADSALVSYTGRYGVAGDIRTDLAPRNASRRSRTGFLGRIFSGVGGQVLDKYRELERLRAAGIQTPSAPPKP